MLEKRDQGGTYPDPPSDITFSLTFLASLTNRSLRDFHLLRQSSSEYPTWESKDNHNELS